MCRGSCPEERGCRSAGRRQQAALGKRKMEGQTGGRGQISDTKRQPTQKKKCDYSMSLRRIMHPSLLVFKSLLTAVTQCEMLPFSVKRLFFAHVLCHLCILMFLIVQHFGQLCFLNKVHDE